MQTSQPLPSVDQLVAPLGECLTPESARLLLALKADPESQQRVDDLAGRHTQGTLSPTEEREYGRYVAYATFIATLKSKARRVLPSASGN